MNHNEIIELQKTALTSPSAIARGVAVGALSAEIERLKAEISHWKSACDEQNIAIDILRGELHIKEAQKAQLLEACKEVVAMNGNPKEYKRLRAAIRAAEEEQ